MSRRAVNIVPPSSVDVLEDRKGARTIASVLRIGTALDLFTPVRPELSLGEVASALGLSKSGTHGLLSTLVKIGLVERASEGRYRLGSRLLLLGRQVERSMDYQRVAAPLMSEFSGRWGETMSLFVLDRGMAVCIHRTLGTHSLDQACSPGTRVHAHSRAAGKILLAGLDSREVDEIAAHQGLPAFTDATITTRGALGEELDRVRSAGYAIARQEASNGLSCIAAPIRSRQTGAIAAISISTSELRLRRQRRAYQHVVVGLAERVAARLRGRPVLDSESSVDASAEVLA